MTKTKKVLISLFILETLLIMALIQHGMNRIKGVHPGTMKLGSIIRLHSFNGNFVCSGTVANHTTIVTAAHCLAGASVGLEMPLPGFEVRAPDGQPTGILAFMAGYNGQADQAVLMGDFKVFDTRNVVTDPKTIIKRFENGKNLMTCGYPYGGKLLCLPIHNPKQFLFQFKATSYLYPGMSGGPVIDEDTGAVIAVNTGVTIGKDYEGDTTVILSPTIEIFASTGTEALSK